MSEGDGGRKEQGRGEKVRPVDLKEVRTRSIADRRELVGAAQFGRVTELSEGVVAFVKGLPDVLAARSLREVAEGICRARREGRPVVMAMGAHVVKCCLGPFVIDMMERGYVTAVAMNGAVPIHDFELALVGGTSEDVEAELKEGTFGMARETAEAMGEAAERGRREGVGLGRAIGELINERKLPHRDKSVLGAAARLGLPATVHVAIGTDVVHMHPSVSAGDVGEASHVDFRVLCGVVSRLEGGVWLNVGSAVVLPEVFLKAVAVARNLDRDSDPRKPANFTAVNMDMLRHYRPEKNVLERPGGRCYRITGHHELMIPLLRMAVLTAEEDGGREGRL